MEGSEVTRPTDGLFYLVTFRLGDGVYGLHIEDVVEVLRMVAITPLPSAPVVVKGVINRRGDVLPVLDIRRRFRLPPGEYGLDARILVVRSHPQPAGVLADTVMGVVAVSADDVELPDDILPGGRCVYEVAKVGEDVVIVLNPDVLLSFEEGEWLDRIDSLEVSA